MTMKAGPIPVINALMLGALMGCMTLPSDVFINISSDVDINISSDVFINISSDVDIISSDVV